MNKNYLSSIVSKPTDENLFHVDTYEKLEDIVDEVGYDICQVTKKIQKYESINYAA